MRARAAAVLFAAAVPLAAVPAARPARAQDRVVAFAETPDPRGAPELTVCQQNLGNYGPFPAAKAREPSLLPETYERKVDGLLARFRSARCDVIAVQEVLGSEKEAAAALGVLAGKLRDVTARRFETAVGTGADPSSRVGFLWAVDAAEHVQTVSYAKLELPKLSPKQRPRTFPRAPLEVQLRTKSNGSPAKLVSLVNMHLKSKRGSAGDPTGLEWETARMEMTEAVRRVVASRHPAAFTRPDPITVVLGDRNSHFDTASARILEGVVALDSFGEGGPCRLSARGVPLCAAGSAFPQKLFSVLTGDPRLRGLPGTFVYKNVGSWLDDILLPAPALRYARTRDDVPGYYAAGVVTTPAEASDHSLVYVRLNW